MCSKYCCYDKPRQCLKSKLITLLTKVCIVKVMVFSAVTYSCPIWTIKKAGCQRIDAFELWCWRRLLKVSWTARRSNQSVLKEINPKYTPEGLLLELKLQYFVHLMWTGNSLEKTLMLAKIEGRRRRGRQRMRWLDGKLNTCLSKLRGMVRDREVWLAAVHRVVKSQTRHGNWTMNNIVPSIVSIILY